MNPIPAVDFKSVFETLPGLYLILTPNLSIAAVSNPYLEATLTKREEIIGKQLFEVFPDNPYDSTADGVSNLRASLNTVLTQKLPHKMPVQKYDVRKPDGVFEERYWSPLNTPVFNAENEIVYIIHNVTDVTNNQRQKEKLQKTETNFKALINSVKDYAIFMVDSNGCIATWNTGAERIKGYTTDEITGRSIDVFYTVEDIQKGVPKDNLRKALQYGRYETEAWRKRKGGTLFWANIVITALHNAKGELYGYSVITRDITERKEAQEQVELLSMQINQSNDAIYTVDADYKIQSWNHGAEKLYGFSKEEALGKNSNMLLNTLISQEKVSRIIKEINENDYWSGELHRKTKNGREIYVLSSNTTIRNAEGIVVGYTSVSFDITEQKQLRRQVNHLASIVEQSSEAIFSRGIDHRIISWNKGAEVLFGYTKEEAIGKTAIELGIIKMSEEQIQNIGNEIIQKGSWKSESDFFHKNGTSFYGAVVSNTVKNEEGDVTAVVFIIKDISLHKQLQEQLKKSNEELEAKVKARTAEITKTERRFRSLIENNNDIIILTNEAFEIIYRSPSAARITGWDNEEMNQVYFVNKVHPDDKEKITGIYNECVVTPGKHLNVVYRTYSKKGDCLYMEGIMINLLQEEHVKAIVLNLRDVTERIAAEEKLASSEVFFRSLIENSAEGVSLLDKSSNVIYRSPASYKMLGNSPKQKSISYAHPDDLTMFKNKFTEALSKPNIPLPYQVRFLHASGNYFWAEGTFTNLLHIKGVNAVVANFRNITEKKKAEESIRKSNERFELVVAATNDVIWDWDLNQNTFWVNKNYYNHFGYDEKKTLQDITAWQEGIHPDDRKRVLAGIRNCIKNQQHFWKEEYRYLKCDKTTAFVMDCGYILYNDSGKAYRMAGAMLDITPRKQAEEKLRESFEEKQALAKRMSVILNTLPANIALLDANGYIIDVNDAWRNFDGSGFIGTNYGIGNNYLHVCLNAANGINEEGKKVAAGITAVLKKKTAEFVYEYACHSAKEKRWFRMVVTPLHEGEYAGAVLMHMDISELRRLEQERLTSKIDEQKKIAKAMLIGQEKERNHLGKELHDNINQILASTKMFLAMAAKKNVEAKELIKYPMELVDMSIDEIRMLSHKMVTQLKNINLEKLIQELLEKMDLTTKIKTKLTYDVADGALSDDLKLNIYRVMQELINNILKYAEAHTVNINVKTNNGIVDVIVKDDGKGFDPEKKQKGIGISNITNRVKSFNGDIIINSAEGKGCVTSITIPY